MKQFGQAMSAWEIAWEIAQLFNMASIFKQPVDLVKLHAVDHFKTKHKFFWCDWDGSRGAMLMIGGGGQDCQQVDHGIAITEAEKASFLEKGQGEHDFGNDGDTGATNNNTYSLNLWMN